MYFLYFKRQVFFIQTSGCGKKPQLHCEVSCFFMKTDSDTHMINKAKIPIFYTKELTKRTAFHV